MTLSDDITSSQTGRNHPLPDGPAIKPASLRTQVCLVFVLVTIGCIIYSNSLQSPFVFDDNGFILNDSACRMTRLNWDSIYRAAFEGQPRHRMIPNISFALNYYFGRYGTFGYHLVNILIHLLTSLILFFFIKNTLAILSSLKNNRFRPGTYQTATDPALVAFFTAMIWMVNPVQTQAVTYICQRMTSMAAMFYILSIFLYIKGRIAMHADHTMRTAVLLYFSACIISGICAVASKENTATLPFFVLLYEWFFFQNLRPFSSKHRLMWVVCAVVIFACIAVIYLGDDPIRRILASYTNRNFTLSQRVLTEFRVVIYYISLLVWPSPARLNLDHDYPLSHSLIDPWTTLSCLIAILGLIYTAVTASKKDRLLSFTIIWFLGNLVIESSVIGIEIIFEHRTYLPFMMAALIPIILLFRHDRLRKIAIPVLCAIVTLLSAWTFQRNALWGDEVAFYEDCANKSPYKIRPLHNMATALQMRGKLSKAADCFQKILRIDPNNVIAYNNMGNIYAKQNNIDQAFDYYIKALLVKPASAHYHFRNSASAHFNLGSLLLGRKMLEESVYHFKEGLKRSPGNADAENRLGMALMQLHNFAEAKVHFIRAIQLNPENTGAKKNLSRLIESRQKLLEREKTSPLKPIVYPENESLYLKLENLYQKQKKYNMAISTCQKELLLTPGDTHALFNLGILFALQGKTEQSVSVFKRLSDLAPDNAIVYYNLACLYAKQDLKKQASQSLKKAIGLGYDNWMEIKADKDLDNIRQTRYYKTIIKDH